MFSRNTLLAASAFALLGACAPAENTDSATAGAASGAMAEPTVAEVRTAIEVGNQRAAAGMVAGDLAAALTNYSDDAVVMMPNMPMMSGRPAIEAGMKGMLDMMKVNAASFTTSDVMVGGDMAIETGTYDMTTTMTGGKPVSDKGKYMTLWKRQADGSWKAIRDINNSDGAPPAATK